MNERREASPRSYAALDTTFSLQAPASVADRLEQLLAPLRTHRSPTHHARVWRSRSGWRVRLDEDDLIAGASFTEAVAELLVAVNRAAAASRSLHDVVLHAAAVELSGWAVALCGPSGAGKSTLAAECVRAGLRLVAEEVCAVHPTGWTVQPYLRPLGLERSRRAHLRAVEDRAAVKRPIGLGLVVLLDRGTVAMATSWSTLRPAEALVELSQLQLNAAGTEGAAFKRLAGLVDAVPVRRLSYQSARRAVPVLRAAALG